MRITFSVPDELAIAARTKAETDRRSLGGYIRNLIERDAAPAAEIVTAEKRAQLLAGADEIGIDKALVVITRAARRKQTADVAA